MNTRSKMIITAICAMLSMTTGFIKILEATYLFGILSLFLAICLMITSISFWRDIKHEQQK